MEAANLRTLFLDFFAERKHEIVPSASLIPHDRSLLFTIAGMVPFKPYFIGDEVAPFSRAASIQKCFRAPDIDIIGTTTRHLTFFEMMGNFSFGDYFKPEAIDFAWGLITEGLGLDPDRLWITVHDSDDEAEAMWRDRAGVDGARIQRLGEDNFWGMGDTGPCGPCSEIFYDKGAQYGEDGGPAFGGSERFVEFWNLVFMQYNRGFDGGMPELPRKNIDTGSGFERVLAIVNNVDSVFATDLFEPLLAVGERAVGVAYGDQEGSDVAIRRIAEHGRAMTMLVADGVLPSNEGRGYVLRRIIRRAILAARRSGSDELLTSRLVDATVEKMSVAYPNLVTDRDLICAVLEREEAAFGKTLRTGMSLLSDAASEVSTQSSTSFPGSVAFRLHDTHGFPLELTAEIVTEMGLEVDVESFNAEMKTQRDRARAASKNITKVDDGAYRLILEDNGTTDFLGRDVARYSLETSVTAVLHGDDGQVEVFLDSTPFYAESGGQVGDTGRIVSESGELDVEDTQSYGGGLVIHRGRLKGEIVAGQTVVAAIDGSRREAIRRNHTATHLLHSALRSVLGDHVRQQGSLVAPSHLRFDFSHGNSIGLEERRSLIELVNESVLVDQDVETVLASRADAEAMGAIAFFGDKYGDSVRVVRAGQSSLEFCGGTHVRSLGEIGQFQIVSEASIGSNTRRIEAVTGRASLERSLTMDVSLSTIADMLKTSPDDSISSLQRALDKIRELEKTVAGYRQAQLRDVATGLIKQAFNESVVSRCDGFTGDQLRELAQDVQQRVARLVIIVGVTPDAKVSVAVASNGEINSSVVVKELAVLIGGGGGGSPTLALAGGKLTDKIEECLEYATRLAN
ncbi:MAG: alanine--tRNA ligase [Actinomycetota bacterium]